jgi:hypothetical protein
MYKAFIFALALPNLAFADCFVVANLKGQSARAADSFAINADGYSNQKFMVEIDKEKASITPSDMRCFMAGLNNVQCIDATDSGQVTIEVWSVFPDAKKVIHTKVNNGYGQHDGGNLFVGDIVGRCG